MRKILFIFGVLGEEDVDWLGGAGRVLRPAPGEALLTQGIPARDLFIILQGQAEVGVAGVGTVARLGAGEMAGEMSFVDAAPPSATVSAGPDAIVLAVPRDAIAARIDRDARFAARFYRAIAMLLSDRLRAATGGGGMDAGELDESVLDTMSSAGIRFEQLVRRASGRMVSVPGGGAGPGDLPPAAAGQGASSGPSIRGIDLRG